MTEKRAQSNGGNGNPYGGNSDNGGNGNQIESGSNNYWIGPTLMGLGANILETRGKTQGATKGTSVASTVLRKVFTYSSPAIKKFTTTVLGRGASTAVLGGAFGRFVPLVGAAWTTLDVTTWLLQNGNYSDFSIQYELQNNTPLGLGPKW